jgi:UPF0176 protein
MSEYQIITFYKFRTISRDELLNLCDRLRVVMRENSIKGTIIVAEEGFNATVAGFKEDISKFVLAAESLLNTKLEYKVSVHDSTPFRRVDVKIKPEIVTLKREVDIEKGTKTHVSPADWNRLVTDPDTLVLDTRNDYEYKTGTFRGAVNPETSKFSELPEFVEKNLNPSTHKRIALFCTGGIRCEKFTPYMRQLGFDEVYQLRGGILKYLEEMPPEESLWQGECFVFDDRVTVDRSLRKGSSSDLSQKEE